MSNEVRDNRKSDPKEVTLVISRTDYGFRVYNPESPTKSYTVGGSPDAPTCTCQEFRYHEGNPNWRCRHISAVLEQLGSRNNDPYEAEERKAIQEEDNVPTDHSGNGNGSQMILKRNGVEHLQVIRQRIFCF